MKTLKYQFVESMPENVAKDGSGEENKYVVFFYSKLLSNIILTEVKTDSIYSAIERIKTLYGWTEMNWVKAFLLLKGVSGSSQFFYEAIRQNIKDPFLSVELNKNGLYFSGYGNSVECDFMSHFEIKNGEKVFKSGVITIGNEMIDVDSELNFDESEIIEELKKMEKAESLVIELIANFMDLPVSFVEPDTELAELRIDSLDKAGISLEIDRKFNHTITDRELSRMTHVRDFINSVQKAIS